MYKLFIAVETLNVWDVRRVQKIGYWACIFTDQAKWWWPHVTVPGVCFVNNKNCVIFFKHREKFIPAGERQKNWNSTQPWNFVMDPTVNYRTYAIVSFLWTINDQCPVCYTFVFDLQLLQLEINEKQPQKHLITIDSSKSILVYFLPKVKR